MVGVWNVGEGMQPNLLTASLMQTDISIIICLIELVYVYVKFMFMNERYA